LRDDRAEVGRAPDSGEGGAHEHRHRVRVGAEVHARRVGLQRHALRDGEPGHPERGDDGAAERGDEHDLAAGEAAACSEPAQAAEDHRPQQVELLLDRERPQVRQHVAAADELEVRLLLAQRPPVADVERSAGEVAQELLGDVGRDRRHEDRGADEHEDERGEQAARAPDVEALEVDAAAHADLGQQQRGDEEAADDEEQVDAEEAAGQPLDAEVVDHDGGDRDRAQAVEPADARRRPGRARVLVAAGRLRAVLAVGHQARPVEDGRGRRGPDGGGDGGRGRHQARTTATVAACRAPGRRARRGAACWRMGVPPGPA